VDDIQERVYHISLLASEAIETMADSGLMQSRAIDTAIDQR